jgi:hypothetical protein
MQTKTDEFIKFYNLLMASPPSGYVPFLFPLEQFSKDPLSSRGSWIAEKNRLSFDEAVRFLKFGYNIGIASLNTDKLVLLDVDDMNAVPESDIKPTLTTITRSRVGSHNFYFSDDPECNVNIPTESGEIRSCNQYLVCPGSFVTTDISTVPIGQEELCGFYTVHNPISPVSITFDEFPKVFRDHHDLMSRSS